MKKDHTASAISGSLFNEARYLLCLLLSVLTLVSCGPAALSAGADAEDGTLYPVTVTDQAGRTVEISGKPERIVSGYYISTSALIALGLKDSIVGIEAKAEKRNIYHLSAPELIGLPNTGTAKDFDLEGCLAMEPDLVILPLRLKEPAETLEAFGLPVLLVNPESQALLEEMIVLLSEVTGTEQRAAELLEFVGGIREKLRGISGETPSVYLAGNSSMLSTAGKNMYQSEMITLAGGKNVAEEIAEDYWVTISYEQLLAWNPEVILMASDASYTVEDVLSDPNLSQCRAVQNKMVIQMPDVAESWDSPVPGGILGSLWLASEIRPEEISSEFCSEMINEFYSAFYGFVYEA